MVTHSFIHFLPSFLPSFLENSKFIEKLPYLWFWVPRSLCTMVKAPNQETWRGHEFQSPAFHNPEVVLSMAVVRFDFELVPIWHQSGCLALWDWLFGQKSFGGQVGNLGYSTIWVRQFHSHESILVFESIDGVQTKFRWGSPEKRKGNFLIYKRDSDNTSIHSSSEKINQYYQLNS